MNKGLIIIAVICFLSASIGLLVLWLKHISEEKKELEERLKQAEADTKKIKAQSEKYTEEKKENEELLQKIHSGNTLDSADASIELMQKLADKGKKRNKH